MFESIKESSKMPVIFVGHGNPMYAITDNPFRKIWSELGKSLPVPNAVLCISAHWVSKGTYISSGDPLSTIYDFYGFPDELYQVNYDVKGNPQLAESIFKSVDSFSIHKDDKRGIDHGAWSVLSNLFPNKDIPVLQLSLDMSKPASYHFKLGQALNTLREQGVLIIGSGNVVHNLYEINWNNHAEPHSWAIEFDRLIEKAIEEDDADSMINFADFEDIAKKAHPTIEHYLPLIYVIANRSPKDKYLIFNNSIENASLSMKSVIFWE